MISWLECDVKRKTGKVTQKTRKKLHVHGENREKGKYLLVSFWELRKNTFMIGKKRKKGKQGKFTRKKREKLHVQLEIEKKRKCTFTILDIWGKIELVIRKYRKKGNHEHYTRIGHKKSFISRKIWELQRKVYTQGFKLSRKTLTPWSGKEENTNKERKKDISRFQSKKKNILLHSFLCNT